MENAAIVQQAIDWFVVKDPDGNKLMICKE